MATRELHTYCSKPTNSHLQAKRRWLLVSTDASHLLPASFAARYLRPPLGGAPSIDPEKEGYRPEGTVKGTRLHPGPLLLAPPGPAGPLLVSSGVGVVSRCRVAAGASRPSGPEVGGERRSRRTRRDDEPHLIRSVSGLRLRSTARVNAPTRVYASICICFRIHLRDLLCINDY